MIEFFLAGLSGGWKKPRDCHLARQSFATLLRLLSRPIPAYREEVLEKTCSRYTIAMKLTGIVNLSGSVAPEFAPKTAAG